MTLDGVGAKQVRLGAPFEDRGEFPAEVVGVLHGYVHALAGFGAVRVARIAGNEHARQAGRCLVCRDVVETVGDALAHLIDGEPGHAAHVEPVRPEHPLRGQNDVFLRDEPERFAVRRVDLAEIDIEPHHVAALTRDEQDVPFVRRLDRRLQPDVREVGVGEHVDDAPGVVGEVAARHGADCVPHAAARAIASDNIFRADLLLLPGLRVLQGDNHGVGARGLDRQGNELPAVIGDKPRRRSVHVVFEVAQQARLIDDQVRKFGQVVSGILHPPGSDDFRSIFGRRTPEDRLVHPVGFADQFPAQAEGVEHLDRAAGDPVRLTDLQRTLATIDDACPDAGEDRELRGQQHPGRAGADDENVRGVGQGRRARLGAGGGRLDVGIPRSVAVEVELHSVVLPNYFCIAVQADALMRLDVALPRQSSHCLQSRPRRGRSGPRNAAKLLTARTSSLRACSVNRRAVMSSIMLGRKGPRGFSGIESSWLVRGP